MAHWWPTSTSLLWLSFWTSAIIWSQKMANLLVYSRSRAELKVSWLFWLDKLPLTFYGFTIILFMRWADWAFSSLNMTFHAFWMVVLNQSMFSIKVWRCEPIRMQGNNIMSVWVLVLNSVIFLHSCGYKLLSVRDLLGNNCKIILNVYHHLRSSRNVTPSAPLQIRTILWCLNIMMLRYTIKVWADHWPQDRQAEHQTIHSNPMQNKFLRHKGSCFHGPVPLQWRVIR